MMQESAIMRSGRLRKTEEARNQGSLRKAKPRSIVCTQMTKTHVLTGRRHRDHIANLDVRVGDDHAVNEEFNQLPLLFPGCLLKAALHPGTEGFHGLRERGQIVLPL